MARAGPRFYVHPTTYLDTDRWNAPLDAGGNTAFRQQNLFLQSQASAFADVDAGLGAALPPSRIRRVPAQERRCTKRRSTSPIATSQMLSIEFVQGSRRPAPSFFPGHSQGALHLERLLREKIAGKPIAKQVVAAYVVGWPISTVSDLPALGLPACRAADKSRCILSWMTFGDPPNPEFILRDWQKTKGFGGGGRRQEDVLCVNPITGIQNGAAAPADNLGSLVPSADLSSATLQAGALGAHCDNGLLILDGIRQRPAVSFCRATITTRTITPCFGDLSARMRKGGSPRGIADLR